MVGKRPLSQGNLPDSMMMPPMVVPCPPMNLVAEWMLMAAPQRNGWHKYGLANVLSMKSGTPAW